MILNPSNQTYLFGHNFFFNELSNLYLKKKLPNKIILSGEKGLGKCTIAYHLVNYVLSYGETNNYDLANFRINSENRNFLLIQNKSNPNFYLIDVEKGKKNIDINQIRNLILDLNKSSFNNKPRFVLIDNIELLNTNSINALLKILEEPNNNIFFLLINNNKNVLPTLRSRCLNFKVSLSFEQSINITNNILKTNINNLISDELINNYSTPGQLLNLNSFSNDFKINLANISLKELISLIIKDNYFKKDNSIKDLAYYLIEVYFRNSTSVQNIQLINLYYLFIKKIDDAKKFNLDDESIFMEFNERILND